ncbi:MAG: alpha/beta hydrolase, partial [Candidatus Electrothrix sp. ATG1]|nr:alpha/beta hydrolase [Candidatus Electrothrix sp. ATG1]
PSVLAARVGEITALRPEQQLLKIPCAYIQAENDRLIPRSHAQDLRDIAPQITVFKIPGPHFIMQTKPEECVQVVRKYVELMY